MTSQYTNHINISRISMANPAGELLKAAMASRLPCLAICGTDSHCKKLEMMLTEFIFEEQQRDGSTFYIPEMKIAKTDEQPAAVAKAKVKAKAKNANKKRKNAEAKDEKDDEADPDAEEEPQPKTKKGKKKNKTTEDEPGSDGSGSSMAW